MRDELSLVDMSVNTCPCILIDQGVAEGLQSIFSLGVKDVKRQEE